MNPKQKTILGLLIAVGFGVTVAFGVSVATAWWILKFATGPGDPKLQSSSLFSVTDTLTIWFAVLGILVGLASLILTGAGFGVAILGLFGYQKLLEVIPEARSAATIAARETASSIATSVSTDTSRKIATDAARAFFEGEQFKDMLENKMTDSDRTGGDDEKSSLAKPYPRGKANIRRKDVS